MFFGRSLVVAAVGGVTALARILIASTIIQATPGLAPSPPSAPTPAPVATPPRRSPSTTAAPAPQQNRPSFLIAMPTLDGKTLHWVQINYGFRPDGRDPSNGQPVTGDIWEELNSNGAAVRFHGHYTFADGTFYQEILQTAGKMTVILGRPNPVNSPAGCALRGQSAPQAVPTAPP